MDIKKRRPIVMNYLRIASGVWLILAILFCIYHIASGIIQYNVDSQKHYSISLRADTHMLLNDTIHTSFDKNLSSHFFGEGRIATYSNNKNVLLVGHIQQIIMALFSAVIALLLRQSLVRVNDNQPLSLIIMRNIRIAGWVIIVYQFIDMASRNLTARVMDMRILFEGTSRISLDIEMFVLGIVLLILSELLHHAHTIEEEQKLTI